MVVLTEQVIINKENKHERLHDIVGKEWDLEQRDKIWAPLSYNIYQLWDLG